MPGTPLSPNHPATLSPCIWWGWVDGWGRGSRDSFVSRSETRGAAVGSPSDSDSDSEAGMAVTEPLNVNITQGVKRGFVCTEESS